VLRPSRFYETLLTLFLLVVIVNRTGTTTRHSADGRPFATARESADGRAARRADADSFNRFAYRMPAVTPVGDHPGDSCVRAGARMIKSRLNRCRWE
jgi:hypothetical protein